MREISVFDVVGPNMIGPSSSHTAGAPAYCADGWKDLQRQAEKGKVYPVWLFAMTYKGHGTDKALLGWYSGHEYRGLPHPGFLPSGG